MFVKITTVLEVCPVSNTESIFFKKEQERFQEFSQVNFVFMLGYCLGKKKKKKSEDYTK